MSTLSPPNIPQHIALIMDGSRRWASKNNLPFKMGHRRAIENLKLIMRQAFSQGVRYITAYALSQENLQRPTDQLHDLFDLIFEYANQLIPELMEMQVAVSILGNWQLLPPLVQTALLNLQQVTSNNNRYFVILAINYSAHYEITHAAYHLAQQVLQQQYLPDFNCFQENFHSYFQAFPYPDLLIRTSEQRLSNFMLWQLAYSEICFIPTLWPDFSIEQFTEILNKFSTTQRRFGL